MMKMWKLRAQIKLDQAKHPDSDPPAIRGRHKTPGAPRQASATGRSISMEWVCQVDDVTRYEVQVRELTHDAKVAKDRPWRTITRNCRDKRITIHDLRSGALFAVRVRARVGNVWSQYSAVSRPARTVKLCPERPAPPTCSEVTTSSIRVTWLPPDDNGSRITIYTLLCGKVVDRGDMVVLYSGPSLECDALNLQPCTRYAFRVIATNGFGDSDVSEAQHQATLTPRTDAPLRTIGCWSEWWDKASRRVYFVNDVYVAGAVCCGCIACAHSSMIASTHERAWELPASLNTLMRRFGEWSEYWDETSQHCFYYNHRTGDRSWEPPADMHEVADAPGAGASKHDDGGQHSDGGGSGSGDASESDSDGEEAGSDAAAPGGASDTVAGGGGAAGAGAGAGAGGGTGGADAGAGGDGVAILPEYSVTDPNTYAVTRTAPVTQQDREFRKKRFQLLWAARLSTVRFVVRGALLSGPCSRRVVVSQTRCPHHRCATEVCAVRLAGSVGTIQGACSSCGVRRCVVVDRTSGYGLCSRLSCSASLLSSSGTRMALTLVVSPRIGACFCPGVCGSQALQLCCARVSL